MDFWQRLVGGSYTPKKPVKPQANDPSTRLARFKRVYTTIHQLCNRPRNISKEAITLSELEQLFKRLGQLVRDETRAPVPHTCLQWAAANQVYVPIARAAAASYHEGVIHAAVTLLSALIDSEEEDFLSSAPFAKSLMRLVTRVVDSGNLLLGIETETAILEMLFTIAAKIRLQPEILPVWFTSTAKPELEDVFVKEKKSFVGSVRKDDFPLCYLLIDRVHHEGRIGDFARTGLLYIFEATGRSVDLEEWIVSSDLSTLMASGLGALYSQLSRELSILHPDATLPAVLAMSDYSTTHTRATAESAFSERHMAHMSTFLSYLLFWQDVLDHSRSQDVKQTLLDHFQILFLQQLLYPSILQSSDTDAGSSVAVLTYVAAILESLEYPDLIHNILTYLLAITETPKAPSVPTTPVRPQMPPRSPTALRRRESLMLLTAPKRLEDTVEPTLFNLVDLIINSLTSKSAQTVFAALRLASTVVLRQKKYGFGTMLKVQVVKSDVACRTIGALELEVDMYTQLAAGLHQLGFNEAYTGLAEDIRLTIEAQVLFDKPNTNEPSQGNDQRLNSFSLPKEDPLLHCLTDLLRTFFTNSVDVNLALTQALIAIASCVELRLDGWVSCHADTYTHGDGDTTPELAPWPSATWREYLDDEEQSLCATLEAASKRPTLTAEKSPYLYTVLVAVARELDIVRSNVPTLDVLISGRKNMLQATSLDAPVEDPHSLAGSPMPSHIETPPASRFAPGHGRSSSTSTARRGRHKATSSIPESPTKRNMAYSPTGEADAALRPPNRVYFQPPPPETPSTTDILMQKITLPSISAMGDGVKTSEERPSAGDSTRTASLNHILTNVVVLQEFVLELVAVLQVRAAVLGDREVRFV